MMILVFLERSVKSAVDVALMDEAEVAAIVEVDEVEVDMVKVDEVEVDEVEVDEVEVDETEVDKMNKAGETAEVKVDNAEVKVEVLVEVLAAIPQRSLMVMIKTIPGTCI